MYVVVFGVSTRQWEYGTETKVCLVDRTVTKLTSSPSRRPWRTNPWRGNHKESNKLINYNNEIIIIKSVRLLELQTNKLLHVWRPIAIVSKGQRI